MKVVECFYSLQGEGRFIGLPSVFIRFAGCNLNCTWCDTKYAALEKNAEEMSVDNILEMIKSYPCRNIVLTGGEPTIQNELTALCKELKLLNYHITKETNGTGNIFKECSLVCKPQIEKFF